MTGIEQWPVSWFQGVMVNKGPYSLFVYTREFIHRGTQLVLETGTQTGGSALWFAVSAGVDVITFDVRPERVVDRARHPNIEFRGDSLASPLAHSAERVSVSLDSDHHPDHIRRELDRFSPLVSEGQILVVEDVLAYRETREMMDDWEREHGHFKRFDVPEVEHFRWYERT